MEEFRSDFEKFRAHARQTSLPLPITDDDFLGWLKLTKGKLGYLRNPTPWNDFTIHRVPKRLQRDTNAASYYTPRTVSIGPLHRAEPDLHPMEEYKLFYMLQLFQRIPDPLEAMDQCGKLVRDLEDDARRCYAENLNYLRKKDLMDVLLLDGCFILELFLRYAEKTENSAGGRQPTGVDPIMVTAWMIPSIQRDLALLENQIPFVVVDRLFEIIILKRSLSSRFPLSLAQYALRFFSSALNLSDEQALDSKLQNGLPNGLPHFKHMLDLLHRIHLPNRPSDTAGGAGKTTWGFRQNATKLLKSGVKLKSDSADKLLNVQFDKGKGTLTIPRFQVNETANSILRNLIAYEQCSIGSSHHALSYVLLMTSLIRSQQDVEELRKRGIVATVGGGDDGGAEGNYALRFFEEMSQDPVVKEFHFDGLCEEVNAYRESWIRWSRIKAWVKVRLAEYWLSLRVDYFKNPWTISSFVAAIVLLALTAFQAYYAAATYYRR